MMIRPWLFDELAHAGAEHLDAAFVAGYDRKQGRPDQTQDLDVLTGHGLDTASTVVDLGAGTGGFAVAVAGRFGRVVAVDISPAMLAALRDRAAHGHVLNLEVVQAGLLTFEYPGPPAAGVYSRNALHHLPDFWNAMALDRIARMLRSGGVLRIRDLIYDLQPAEVDGFLDQWLAGAATDPAAGYTTEDYTEHVRTEHSTFRWLFEPMLAAAGFDIVTVEFDRSVFAAYTCIKR